MDAVIMMLLTEWSISLLQLQSSVLSTISAVQLFQFELIGVQVDMLLEKVGTVVSVNTLKIFPAHFPVV